MVGARRRNTLNVCPSSSVRVAPLAIIVQTHQTSRTHMQMQAYAAWAKARSCKARIGMHHCCAQPMRDNPSAASLGTTVRGRTRDAGDMQSSGTRKTTCSRHQYRVRSAFLLRSNAQAMRTKQDRSYTGTPSSSPRPTTQCVSPMGGLTQILDAMRAAGGKQLRHEQWHALLNTERRAGQPADASAGWLGDVVC